jgi:hypothetical protein
MRKGQKNIYVPVLWCIPSEPLNAESATMEGAIATISHRLSSRHTILNTSHT